MERKALGRGLGALIPERAGERQEKISYVPTESVRPNPFQPREDFDPQSLEELTQSIKEKGVIQPILVRRRGDFYELIAGERRLRACKSLGHKEIPVIIRDVNDQDSLEISLIENIQRQGLNPIEEARAYQYLIEKFQITQEKIGEVLGIARTSVTNTLRLLKLPLEIQEELKKGRLTFGHGRALLEVTDLNQQRKLAQETIAKGLSVRELESLVRGRRSSHIPKRRMALVGQRETYLAVMEEQLQHALATKVRITKHKKRGHIAIEFYSPQDLERIVRRIRGGSAL
jgi:ParB family chromosome partitioning protein